MKIKKIASICSKTKFFQIYDRIGPTGEITQWLGDGFAMYPLNGLPILDEESLSAMFDITEKKREKLFIRRDVMPDTVSIADVEPGDRRLSEGEISVVYGGTVLKPLYTRNGIAFIKSLYLSPLEDEMDFLQFFERDAPQGGSYIVAKAGLMIVAVILPFTGINEKFVERMETLTSQCRRALMQYQQEPPAVEQDPDQGSIFAG